VDTDAHITVATWNTEWASARGERAEMVRRQIADADADVFVVTEGRQSLLPEDGHVVDGGNDWGYGIQPERRKVILWSRWPIGEVTRVDTGAGSGRVLCAVIDTPLGPLRVLAVCIPWSSAHVSTGRRDATTWSEHLECIDQLHTLRAGFDPEVPTVIAGDVNQRLPRVRQRIDVAARLVEVLDGWVVHTAGDVDHGPLIDHIASTLTCEELHTWPTHRDGVRLSDHSGVACRLRFSPRRGASG